MTGFERGYQLCKLVGVRIEVGQREPQGVRQQLLDRQCGLMHAHFVSVDAGACGELVDPDLDTEIALRDVEDLPRLAQSAGKDGNGSLVSQSRADPDGSRRSL